ncbi:MAG TPA: TonB-dependent receptor, partial [Bacteroidia bacterium]|nr:TonB-dependent receptor [Bacteroidia bacterium]
VNRPEFREWSPFKFYDFDFNADIYGSLFKSVLPKSGQVLETCTIDNFDLRYEYYPSNGEMIHIGAFYKNFINPIEQYILPSSNRLFTFANAASAYSYGLELDLKKNLGSISSKLKNFNLVANTSFIKSQIKLDFAFNQSLTRPLQGQSPYVINTGVYYSNDEKELQITALYNVVGPRIFLVGTNDYASWGELSKNNIDLSVTKKIANRLSVNVQIQDILNQPVWVVQDTNQDDKFSRKGEDLTIMKYKRGQFFNLGIRYAL